MWRKMNPLISVGMKTGAATAENSVEVSQKTLTLWPTNPTLGYISKNNGKQNTNLKRYMHPNVHGSIICNFQDMEVTWMFISKWMD